MMQKRKDEVDMQTDDMGSMFDNGLKMEETLNNNFDKGMLLSNQADLNLDMEGEAANEYYAPEFIGTDASLYGQLAQICKQQVQRGTEEAHALALINKRNEGHMQDKAILQALEKRNNELSQYDDEAETESPNSYATNEKTE